MGDFPSRLAEQLLRERFFVRELPVNLNSIADSLSIDLKPMPSSADGVSGMLLRLNNQFAICYATHIKSRGFQRFSIAHELGHYFLPSHPERVFINGIHLSNAGFESNKVLEQEADQFAASFLMPAYLFDAAIDSLDISIDNVKNLADLCETSLIATAIRLIQRTSEPAAVIVSSGVNIDYAFLSDALKEFPKLTWLKKGQPLPRASVTHDILSHRQSNKNRDEATGDFQEWFGGSIQGEIYEEVIKLGTYGKTLTILDCSDLPTLDELGEEHDLIESWTPRFRR